MKSSVYKKTEIGFARDLKAERVLLLCDQNTVKFESAAQKILGKYVKLEYGGKHIVPNENALAEAKRAGRGCTAVLALGSGTLNDLAKAVAQELNIFSAVYCTAPSMDGYASPVAAMIEGKSKVSRIAAAPRMIFVDYDVLCNCPKNMVGAGAADILGKYTCLADWLLAQRLTGESYRAVVAQKVLASADEVSASADELAENGREGIEKLTEALLLSGEAMAEVGNSRPASGSEHHMSHFIELDFLRRGKIPPLHGVTVGLGTLVSLKLYEKLPLLIGQVGKFDLPSESRIRDILKKLGCPVCYRDIGVSLQTVREMIENSHTIRERFTILTALHQRDMLRSLSEEISDLVW